MVPEKYWQALKLIADKGLSPIDAANEVGVNSIVFLNFYNHKLGQREARLRKEEREARLRSVVDIGETVYYPFNGQIYISVVKQIKGDTIGFSDIEEKVQKWVPDAWVFKTYEQALEAATKPERGLS